MTSLPSRLDEVARVQSLAEPQPPRWVESLLARHAPRSDSVRTPLGRLQVIESGSLALLSLDVHRAVTLGDDEFRSATEDAYVTLLGQLRKRGVHALRFWNYVPDIARAAADGFTRYEVFSAGRFAAYRDWFEGDSFDKQLRPATAVGHRGPDLVVHVLAGEHPGAAIENPRQRPAYQYSERYGPCPPSFARALRIAGELVDGDSEPLGIISGTASIVGEDTTHCGDLAAQLDEICTNLATLSFGICGEPRHAGADVESDAIAEALGRYRDLRVYLTAPEHADFVRRIVEERFAGLEALELVAADLCRRELLIEIEGVLRGQRGPRCPI